MLIFFIIFYLIITFITQAQIFLNYKNIFFIEVFNLIMLMIGKIFIFSFYSMYIIFFIRSKKLISLRISATPSMYIATDVLLAQWGWSTRQNIGITFVVFTIIMLGSIHLGWHYALDGYVGGIGSHAIWHGVDWLLRKSPLNNASRLSSLKTSMLPSAS